LGGVTSAIQTQLNAKVASTRTIIAGVGLTGGGNLSQNRTIDGVTQDTATWEAGTGTTESLVSPAKVKAAVKPALNASGDAPIYACRAWVDFNGTGTVSIRASGNVSSITDNGTGDYTINFAVSMPSNYAVVALAGQPTSGTLANVVGRYASSSTSVSVVVKSVQASTTGPQDNEFMYVAIFC
jgi:hypothetical protein